MIFAASQPVSRETLAAVIGSDCNLDLLIADIRAELKSRPYELPHADLLGGQVQVIFDPVIESIGCITADRLRPLAVTTAMRSEALPDLPTVGDFVPGYETSGWFGIGVPSNTPVAIIDKLNKEINAGLADPRIKGRFADLCTTVFPGSPADFGKLIAEETEKWAKVVKFAGIKAD